ncbi:RHS repeat-associated core domain-containing protein, partial [Clostridium folliculivorans]|uniref:RHS repeat-associated core domain-containing protein n=1 Tax=Clostridium folliculivorans TaxID=2886038 RepID=UPI0021C42F59
LGQVKDKYRYDPYGEVKHGGFWGSNATHYENFYGYNGEDYNRLSGLDYLRARYYEPESGRFLTRDSYLGNVMQPLTLNRYAYALNNPMMYTDPSGHWPGWLDKAASAVSSFASSVVDTVVDTVSKVRDYVRDRIADANYFNPPDEGNKNGYTNKPVTVPRFPENPLEVSKKNTTNSNRVNSCFSQPQITTRNYSNEVVRKAMDTIKKSCEGTQFLGSQNYDYKEKVSQGTDDGSSELLPYQRDVQNLRNSDNIIDAAKNFGKYLWDRWPGLWGQINEQNALNMGMDPEWAKLTGEFSSTLFLEGFTTITVNGVRAYKNIKTGEVIYDSSVVAGSGIGNIEKGAAEAVKWKGFSKGELAEHFAKHGNEFGDITQNQYLKLAKDFATESNSAFRETKVGNFIIKYDEATRRILVGQEKSREIRTFYKADFRDADPFEAAVNLAKQLSGIK